MENKFIDKSRLGRFLTNIKTLLSGKQDKSTLKNDVVTAFSNELRTLQNLEDFAKEYADSQGLKDLVRFQMRIKVLPFYTRECDSLQYTDQTLPDGGTAPRLSWKQDSPMRFVRIATQGNFDFGKMTVLDFNGIGEYQKNEIVCFARAYRRAKRKKDGYTYKGKIKKGYFPVHSWDVKDGSWEKQYVGNGSYWMLSNIISGKDLIMLNDDSGGGTLFKINKTDNKTFVSVRSAYKRKIHRSFEAKDVDRKNYTLSVHVAFARRISWADNEFITGEPIYGKITLTYNNDGDNFSMSFVQK